METTREVFETNTFGVIAMTQAVVPQFRERRSGVVVNVTSSATLTPMPLAAVYTASKMAIEGFTGSLAFELEFFNVRVKLVEPGYGPNTSFTSMAHNVWKDCRTRDGPIKISSVLFCDCCLIRVLVWA